MVYRERQLGSVRDEGLERRKGGQGIGGGGLHKVMYILLSSLSFFQLAQLQWLLHVPPRGDKVSTAFSKKARRGRTNKDPRFVVDIVVCVEADIKNGM